MGGEDKETRERIHLNSTYGPNGRQTNVKDASIQIPEHVRRKRETYELSYTVFAGRSVQSHPPCTVRHMRLGTLSK